MIESTTATAFGTLLDAQTIRFVRDLPGPIERVWAYLTESDLRATWIAPGGIPATVGDEITKTWEGENGEPGGALTLRTRVFDPPHVLEYDWIELDAPGGAIRDSVVRMELATHGDGVRLTLTHRALPTDSYATIAAGWHAHLDTLVAQITDAGGPDAFARYAVLQPHYGAFGSFPSAGTVRLERVIAAPIERTWSYLAEPALIATWLGHADVPTRVGTTFTIALLAGDTVTATLRAYAPARVLEYTWFAGEHEAPREDPSVVHFELAPHDDGTLLILTHTGVLPEYPGRVGAGWHGLLDALAMTVAGQTPPPFADAFARVIEAYESLARTTPAPREGA